MATRKRPRPTNARVQRRQRNEDTRRVKIMQVLRTIEEGMMRHVEQTPQTRFSDALKAGKYHAGLMVKSRKIGLPNIDERHYQAALRDLQQRGRNSPTKMLEGSFKRKKEFMKTEEEVLGERMRKRGIKKDELKTVIRSLHPKITQMLEERSLFPGDALGLIAYECQQAKLNYKEAQNIANFFVEYDPISRENVFTREYHALVHGKPRPLVKPERTRKKLGRGGKIR